jgi:hypothetical protein
MSKKYDLIDEMIGRAVGRSMFFVLADYFDDLKLDPDDPKWEPIVGFNQPEGWEALRAADPVVPYPMVFLGSYFQMGRSKSPFIFPPLYGEPLRLNQYLECVNLFVTLQFSGSGRGHVPLLSYAINRIVDEHSWSEALTFVDGLWRGRSGISASQWGMLRRTLLSEGSESVQKKLESDEAHLTAEAIRLVQLERSLKPSAKTLDGWLHGLYCMLPDLYTWFFPIRKLAREKKSDELGKFDRVIDEFLADIGTSIAIPSMAIDGGGGFSDEYLLKPLLKHKGNMAAAVEEIRGISRGRTIVPQFWYEYAKALVAKWPAAMVAEKVSASSAYDTKHLRGLLSVEDCRILDGADPCCAFGRSVADHWDSSDPSSMVLSMSLGEW